MKHQEKGVYGDSIMAFHIPSSNALEHLYYYNYTGEFFCNSQYRIQREEKHFDSPYLFVLIQSGALYLDYLGHTYCAQKGDIMLFNCHLPHAYYCKDRCHFKYVHFGGAESDYLVEQICKNHQYIISPRNGKDLNSCMTQLINYTEDIFPNEFLISSIIYRLLIHTLTEKDTLQVYDTTQERIVFAINAMKDHLSEHLSVQDMARMMNLNTSYFIRLFHEYTKMSPLEYLTSLRIANAKRLLSETNDSIVLIAEQCGYVDSSYFIRQFKKNVGSTPLQFRKYQKHEL